MEHARCTKEQREFMKYKMKENFKELHKEEKAEGNMLKHRIAIKKRK